MNAFNQKYEKRWKIRWNENTGTPASILGHRITSYSGTPEEIASAFLQNEKGMLGIANVKRNLDLKKINYSERGGSRLFFTQIYIGVPLLTSGYLVAVHNDGSIYYVSGNYYPDVKIETIPKISAPDVTAIIETDLAGGAIDNLSEPVLSILPEDDETVERYTLVYQVDASTSVPTAAWRYTVDANSGTIIAKIDLIE